MSDLREPILVRMTDICEGLTEGSDPLVATVKRNDFEFNESELPGICLLDGDEEVDEQIERPNRPANTSQIVHMIPQVLIKVAGKREEVGPALNAIRAALIKALKGDAQLNALVGPNGAIKYFGLVTDLAYGRAMLGESVPRFLIKYLMNPRKL